MSNTWKDGAGFTDVLVADDGKILGEVSKAINTGWHATHLSNSLGRYYTREAAKAAVEEKTKDAS